MKKTILGNDNSSGHVVTNWKLTSSEIPLNIKVSFYVFLMLKCLLFEYPRHGISINLIKVATLSN